MQMVLMVEKSKDFSFSSFIQNIILNCYFSDDC